MFKIATGIVLALLLLPGISEAHPGNTDVFGRHTCYTNCPSWGLSYGQYHGHGKNSSKEKGREKTISDYRAERDILQRQIAERAAMFREHMQAMKNLESLASLDREIKKKERMLKEKHLEPLDREMRTLRNQYVSSRAQLYSELGELSPSQRAQVLNAHSKYFEDRMEFVSDTRAAREKAIRTNIEEMEDERDAAINAAKMRIMGVGMRE